MNSVYLSGTCQLGFGQMPKPDPSTLAKDQLIIKVEACVINPSDVLFMRNKYGVSSVYPYTPGWEGSGTVVDASPLMDEATKGYFMNQRVAFVKQGEGSHYTIGGGMAEYIVTSMTSVIPVPPEIDFDHASSFFVNPLTAIGMVERAKELGATSCIVTAAAS
mmetsp:Transcript_597/g.1144  ORF Transcript_597/g.1144 Transcript_597/m.1144 type:complete len:162 (-) Transcript_597:644-1129(-)